MALPPTTNLAATAHAAPGELPDHNSRVRLFVMALFFIFGGVTALNDVLIPKFKELFALNYTQAMLVQFCFFTAYAVVGIPAAGLVKKMGYMRGAFVGLLIMMTGCLLFIPASQTATYAIFLFALFVLASGVVVVQVVANPLISMLGSAATAHSRLTFAQAFNSLGTTLFPFLGATLILGGLASVSADQLTGEALNAYRIAESKAIAFGYLGLSAVLAIVAGAVWTFRNSVAEEAHEESDAASAIRLLARPRFGFGALSIFLYVGAEVSIGSLIVNYLQQPDVLDLPGEQAGKLIGIYWGGAMIGRFAGSLILRAVRPARVLLFAAAGALILIAISSVTEGMISGYSLLSLGLMNSIMFPTIFTLACEGLGDKAADGSGIINVAIFGGAVIPIVTGLAADIGGSLTIALVVPAICYLSIARFAAFSSNDIVTGESD